MEQVLSWIWDRWWLWFLCAVPFPFLILFLIERMSDEDGMLTSQQARSILFTLSPLIIAVVILFCIYITSASK